jgi:hypothetical protein
MSEVHRPNRFRWQGAYETQKLALAETWRCELFHVKRIRVRTPVTVLHRTLAPAIRLQHVLGIQHKYAQKIAARNGADKDIAGQQQ